MSVSRVPNLQPKTAHSGAATGWAELFSGPSWLGSAVNRGAGVSSGGVDLFAAAADDELEPAGDDMDGIGLSTGNSTEQAASLAAKKAEQLVNERLRARLLGSSGRAAHTSKQATPHSRAATSKYSKPGPKPEESEDEEEGRSTAFKSKRTVAKAIAPQSPCNLDARSKSDEEDDNSSSTTPAKSTTAKGRGKSKSILDDLLQQRAAKRRRKGGKGESVST